MHIRYFTDPVTGARSDFLVGHDEDGAAAFVLLGSNGLPVLGAQQMSANTVRVISAYMTRPSDGVTLVGTVAEVLDLIAPQLPPAEPENLPVEEETVTNDEPTTPES